MEGSVMKPLFIPLKKEFYLAFKDGSKAVEYRKAGKSSPWNKKTCEVGRRVTISNGYTKKDRLQGVIVDFKECSKSGKRKEFVNIYGDGHKAACISIKLD